MHPIGPLDGLPNVTYVPKEINTPQYKASLQQIALSKLSRIDSPPLRTLVKHNNEPNNPNTSRQYMTCQIAMGNICCDKKTHVMQF